jgi:hypothetical protein
MLLRQFLRRILFLLVLCRQAVPPFFAENQSEFN